MASDITQFGLREMLACSLALREAGKGARTMEEAARRACNYLYEELRGPPPASARACALVRCYKTHAYAGLDGELQTFARQLLGAVRPRPEMKCLTLLASVGERPGWRSRRTSKGHQAIPLVSPEIVEKAPMIAQLVKQFGLRLADVVQPEQHVVKDLQGKTYNVFHVPEAAGSPYIPAQEDFVARYGIRSVVGFGGALAGSDLFAVILFAKAPVSAESADRFRSLALDVKSSLFPFGDDAVFEHFRGSRVSGSLDSDRSTDAR